MTKKDEFPTDLVMKIKNENIFLYKGSVVITDKIQSYLDLGCTVVIKDYYSLRKVKLFDLKTADKYCKKFIETMMLHYRSFLSSKNYYLYHKDKNVLSLLRLSE